jgi:hypothetical protein
MTPWDSVRVAEAIGAKVLMPMHWDNWGNTYIDPATVPMVADKILPQAKVVIPAWGVKWVYPAQAGIGRMRWPDWRERYRPEHSWEYGQPAQEAADARGEFIPY